MPQDENPQIPSDMDLVFPELYTTPEYPMTLPELVKTHAMEEAPPGTGPASMPSFDAGGTSFMSGLTSAMANIGGIAGALGAGGPQAMTNFVNKITERQNLELSQSWAAYQKQQERDHQNERDALNRAHDIALLEKKWELEGGKELKTAGNTVAGWLSNDATGFARQKAIGLLTSAGISTEDLDDTQLGGAVARHFGTNLNNLRELVVAPTGVTAGFEKTQVSHNIHFDQNLPGTAQAKKTQAIISADERILAHSTDYKNYLASMSRQMDAISKDTRGSEKIARFQTIIEEMNKREALL